MIGCFVFRSHHIRKLKIDEIKQKGKYLGD